MTEVLFIGWLQTHFIPKNDELRRKIDCDVSVFMMLYKREAKTHKMKGETLKIYRTILKFDKATSIPIMRWSFVRAGFRLNPTNLLAPLTVTPADLLARIAVLEIGLEHYVFSAPLEVSLPAGRSGHRTKIFRLCWNLTNGFATSSYHFYLSFIDLYAPLVVHLSVSFPFQDMSTFMMSFIFE
jgi:hypothetical protein